ncbi:MAG: hypothetical protein U0Q12_07550 [Vicinamibacterales bacterium]
MTPRDTGSTARTKHRRTSDDRSCVSRRRALGLLAATGVAGPVLADAAQKGRTSVAVLKQAQTLLDSTLDDGRLAVVTSALQSNLGQFQVVRDLQVDDLVEPAPMFHARRKA